MHPPRLVRVAAPLLVGALVLSACGSKKEEDSSGGGKTYTLGVIAPLTGDLSAIGLGIKHGVELAVKQANANKTIDGVTLKVQAEDDAADPDTGARVAARLVANSSVVGVVGPLNSSVAKSVAPVLSAANLTEISPANSNVDLTGRGALLTGAKQVRPYKSYFRAVTTDDIQGPFDAQFAVQTLKAKRIAIVHDKKAYGQGLAQAVAAEAKKLGANVLPTLTVNPDDKDFSAIVTTLKSKKPDFLFYGGEYPAGGLLKKQMYAGGLRIPLMGGDGMDVPNFVKTGGKQATEGDYVSGFGAPAEKLSSAKQFLEDYTAAKFADPMGPYGAYAFDSANAIIKALSKAAEEKKSGAELRAEVTKEVGESDFDGVTGHISFDEFGDTNLKVLTVSKIVNGQAVATKTAEFK
ncbi:MAG TPA: branched-chain amino acid ABC transporter substrate-binding protein [Mycobacteriales bacterium]|nr:branched-chain amino acid ABC transporter substrate-binding protein [Mycobacteriales bacterium]